MTIQQIENKIAEKTEELKNVKGTTTEVYSRIVGYYRPVKQFNKGQLAQYKTRKLYKKVEK